MSASGALRLVVHEAPVGPLTLVSDGAALVGCYFAGNDFALRQLARDAPAAASDALLDRARDELDAYFAGRRCEFGVTLAPRGTPFQLAVWEALRRIPYGATATYGGIAREIGRPAAVRAVGAANGQNPICIFVPCHRVIGADGSLTGFGGGLDRKRLLLALERGERALF